MSGGSVLAPPPHMFLRRPQKQESLRRPRKSRRFLFKKPLTFELLERRRLPTLISVQVSWRAG